MSRQRAAGSAGWKDRTSDGRARSTGPVRTASRVAHRRAVCVLRGGQVEAGLRRQGAPHVKEQLGPAPVLEGCKSFHSCLRSWHEPAFPALRWGNMWGNRAKVSKLQGPRKGGPRFFPAGHGAEQAVRDTCVFLLSAPHAWRRPLLDVDNFLFLRPKDYSFNRHVFGEVRQTGNDKYSEPHGRPPFRLVYYHAKRGGYFREHAQRSRETVCV